MFLLKKLEPMPYVLMLLYTFINSTIKITDPGRKVYTHTIDKGYTYLSSALVNIPVTAMSLFVTQH
jgi:hypothetical protein